MMPNARLPSFNAHGALPPSYVIAGGFASGGVQSGSIDGAIQGAVASGFMYGAGSVAEALLAQEVAAAGERFAPGSGAREAAAQAAGSSSVWASGGIGRAGLHAVVGCVQHVGGGGKCGQGALSAGFAEVAGPMLPGEDGSTTRLAGHIVVGGVGSVLGGGKFKNGAITGAFGYLYNEVQHTRGKVYVVGYNSQDDAALAALQLANPLSIDANLEYGGLIYRNPSGGYEFTGPIRGTEAGVNPFNAPVPGGAALRGDYHTHGDYSIVDSSGKIIRTGDPKKDSFRSDSFSSSDIRGITAAAKGIPGYRGYLGTPSGVFRMYDPLVGKEVRFP